MEATPSLILSVHARSSSVGNSTMPFSPGLLRSKKSPSPWFVRDGQTFVHGVRELTQHGGP
ncbi:hypothetical protein BDA96_05G175600 [Sorghum bicolor]|nr:hypothetical protein BDA96_05G175600 [Sorghum bicolor]